LVAGCLQPPVDNLGAPSPDGRSVAAASREVTKPSRRSPGLSDPPRSTLRGYMQRKVEHIERKVEQIAPERRKCRSAVWRRRGAGTDRRLGGGQSLRRSSRANGRARGVVGQQEETMRMSEAASAGVAFAAHAKELPVFDTP